MHDWHVGSGFQAVRSHPLNTETRRDQATGKSVVVLSKNIDAKNREDEPLSSSGKNLEPNLLKSIPLIFWKKPFPVTSCFLFSTHVFGRSFAGECSKDKGDVRST